MPMDVHQDEFKGEVDNQLLPMVIDQDVVGKPGNQGREVLADKNETNLPKVSDSRSVPNTTSSAVTQDILDSKVTLTVKQIAAIAPGVRRELGSAVKQVREVLAPVQEKRALMSGVALEDGETLAYDATLAYGGQTSTDESFGLGQSSEKLLSVPAKVGRSRAVGIFDSGSQVTLMSQNLVEKS